MTAPPIIIPELTFVDANGLPYAGGTLATYVAGTSTPKATWLDPGQTALRTNPIVLDAAGRCLVYGDGDYRLILRDDVGNQIWDIQATTLVSAAMYPVVSAPTIADAQALLGIDGSVSAEAAARAAADSAEQTARIAADTAETNARTAADTTLQANIDAETARAEAAEAALGGGTLTGAVGHSQLAGGNVAQWGSGATNSGGTASVTFPVPFPSACDSLVATTLGNSTNMTIRVYAVSLGAFDVFIEDAGSGGGQASQFYWQAHGH